MSNPTTARPRGQRRRGMAWWRERANGLRDDSWVPVLFVDGRIIADLLAGLRRAGIPAYCARCRPGWHFPPRRNAWCLWVGSSDYGRAEERLAEVVPLLIGSWHRAQQRRDPSACLRNTYRQGGAGHDRDS